MRNNSSRPILAAALVVLVSLLGCSDDEKPEPTGGSGDTTQETGGIDSDGEGGADTAEIPDTAADPGDLETQEDSEIVDEDTGGPDEGVDTAVEDHGLDGEPTDVDDDSADGGEISDTGSDSPDDVVDTGSDTPDDTATEPDISYTPCNEVPGTAGLVAQLKQGGSAPTPAMDGAVSAGTYHMIADVLYGEPGSSALQSKQRWDVTVVSATELTLEIAYQETSPVSEDPESHTATLLLTGGTDGTFAYTCVSAPGYTLNDPTPVQISVSADGGTVKVYFQHETLTRVLTFSLMS